MSILDRTVRLRRFEGSAWLKWPGGLAVAILVLLAISAPANAQTRSLKLYFIHTKERAEITYMRNGRYLKSGLAEINRFLRDWRRNESIEMDPRLLDLVWSVYRAVGARDYIHVVSAYRSPETNKMLRSRSSGVAKKSQHMLGKAMDFYIPGVPLSKLRAAAFKAEGGGVGYYPKSGSPFVHLDVGNVRSWPRMSRSQLLALFPDGNTIHLPADGKPLPGYKQALAAYEARKLSGKSIQIASADGGGRSGGGLLSALFGGGADEEEDSSPELTAPTRATAAARPSAPVAQPEPERETPETIIAALPERSIPVPNEAPRPVVDVGAPSTPLIAGLPANEVPPATQAEEEAVALALDIPLPTSRPDYTPPVQVAAAEEPEPAASDVPISAILGTRPQSDGSEAISEMLAMTAAEARADVVMNPPLPDTRPETQVASADAGDADSRMFVLASLPETGGVDQTAAIRTGAQEIAALKEARSAALAASPRIAVMSRAEGSDATAALDSGVRTTAKSARPDASLARPDPQAHVIPVEHELTRWAFRRNVTVANAGGTEEPARAHAIVRSAPEVVYTTGFQQGQPQAEANRFTGKAVSFISVARFAAN